jgi:hypothetical protein
VGFLCQNFKNSDTVPQKINVSGSFCHFNPLLISVTFITAVLKLSSLKRL